MELSNLDKYSRENLSLCFSCMDLTSLHNEDTPEAVAALMEKVNALPEFRPSLPLPASVCVFPDFVQHLSGCRKYERVHICSVAGAFPTSHTFPEVKALEASIAVEKGADEVDIVLSLSDFLSGRDAAAKDEIERIRLAVHSASGRSGRKAILKVILETGILQSEEAISRASFLAMEAGADFIKTSTGKTSVGATPFAAEVMCKCIKAYYEASGRKVGFKAAGGIKESADALCYLSIVKTVLGDEWLTPEYFRIGCSSLGNSLITSLEGEKVSYF